MDDSAEAERKQIGDVYSSDKIVNIVEILAQSSTDFALTCSFQDPHVLGSHLCDCDSTAFLLLEMPHLVTDSDSKMISVGRYRFQSHESSDLISLCSPLTSNQLHVPTATVQKK